MLDAPADAEDALFWLGRARLAAASHEVTIPQAAFDLGLFEPGEQAFWAADPEVSAAFVSSDEDLFEDDDGVLLAGSHAVDDDGETTVPSLLVAGGTGEDDDVAVFPEGVTVHLLTNPELLDAGVCLAAPAEAARDMFATRLERPA